MLAPQFMLLDGFSPARHGILGFNVGCCCPGRRPSISATYSGTQVRTARIATPAGNAGFTLDSNDATACEFADSVYAEYVSPANPIVGVAPALLLSDFGFSIPPTAAIVSWSVRIKGYADSANTTEDAVKLFKLGGYAWPPPNLTDGSAFFIPTNPPTDMSPAVGMPTSNDFQTTGTLLPPSGINPNALIPAHANAVDFGVALEPYKGSAANPAGGDTAHFDFVEMTINYRYTWSDQGFYTNCGRSVFTDLPADAIQNPDERAYPTHGPTVFTDLFASNPGGYTETPCGSPMTTAFDFIGGYLTETYSGGPPFTGGGTYMQAITIPPLDGLCISIGAQIHSLTGKTTGITGVCIGDIGSLFCRWTGGGPTPTSYAAWNSAGPFGCVDALGTLQVLSTGPLPSTAVVILRLRDTSGGAGVYSLDCLVSSTALNDSYPGTYLYSFDNMAYSLTPGDPIQVGLIDTNGGKWSCLYISTS